MFGGEDEQRSEGIEMKSYKLYLKCYTVYKIYINPFLPETIHNLGQPVETQQLPGFEKHQQRVCRRLLSIRIILRLFAGLLFLVLLVDGEGGDGGGVPLELENVVLEVLVNVVVGVVVVLGLLYNHETRPFLKETK